MAPNRKHLQHCELPADSLDLERFRLTLVQSKFLPLTDPRSQEQLEQLDQEQQQQRLQQADSQSYWEWTTDVDIVDVVDKKIQEKETSITNTVDLFSIAHIEANLIADAKKYASSLLSDEPEHDNHHNHHHRHVSVSQSAVRRPQHERNNADDSAASSYWDWSINTSEYEEELAQRLTSSTHIMKNLVKTHRNFNSSEQYWTWETGALTIDDDVLEKEGRDYWTWNANVPPTTMDAEVVIQNQHQRQQDAAESDAYWDSTTPSGLSKICDEPWCDSMKTAQAVLSSGKSYWDW